MPVGDSVGGTPQPPRTPTHVVVDTSVLRKVGGDLRKGDWPTLRAAARNGIVTLCLPYTVLMELVDHRRRDIGRLAKVEAEHRALRSRIFGESSRLSVGDALDVERVLEQYTDNLVAWFEETGRVLPQPSVGHEALTERLLAKRKPFTEGERGYRDALIWFAVLECAETCDVVLLTANTRDFASGASNEPILAEDLVADLSERGYPAERVMLSTSTSSLLERVLPAWDEPAADRAWRQLIRSTDGVSRLNDLLERYMGIELQNPPDLPQSIWGIGVRTVERVDNVRDVVIVPDSDGWFRIHCRLTTESRIGGFCWVWGGAGDDLSKFVEWDNWGGATEYLLHSDPWRIDIVVAAKFRPLTEVVELNIVSAIEEDRQADGRESMRRVHRELTALRRMLDAFDITEELVEEIHAADDSEFESVVAASLARWEDVADDVPGRYTALVTDNLHVVLETAPGLRALARDLGSAVRTLDDLLT